LVAVAITSAKVTDRYLNHLKKHAAKYERWNKLPADVQQRRAENFLKAKEYIQQQNQKVQGYVLGSNEHLDRDRGRFIQERCRLQLPANTRSMPALTAPTTPPLAAVNWTSFAQPVVGQGGCGSCWAFATIAVVGKTLRKYLLFLNSHLICFYYFFLQKCTNPSENFLLFHYHNNNWSTVTQQMVPVMVDGQKKLSVD